MIIVVQQISIKCLHLQSVGATVINNTPVEIVVVNIFNNIKPRLPAGLLCLDSSKNFISQIRSKFIGVGIQTVITHKTNIPCTTVC